MATTVTLSELARLTGAKPRTLQLWADQHIIVPVAATDDAGTGVHRQFDEIESQIAALLVPIARADAGKKWLRTFSDLFRKHLRAQSKDDVGRALRRGLKGDGANYLAFAFSQTMLHLRGYTDEGGRVCIDPLSGFAREMANAPAAMIGVINVTAVLGSFRA
jgi:hypothetical protein